MSPQTEPHRVPRRRRATGTPAALLVLSLFAAAQRPSEPHANPVLTWCDHDGDGTLYLLLRTLHGDELYRHLGSAYFERVDLGPGRPLRSGARLLTPVIATALEDQAGGVPIMASRVPTLDMFLPYPGDQNVFIAPAVVAGGRANTAVGLESTVAGGATNMALGDHSAVGGGEGNTAGGVSCTVPGGLANEATGDYSFAAGRNARALHAGAFVWGDSGVGVKSSPAPDTFNIFASGGINFFADAAANTGVMLPAGGGSWSSLSDRALKENVVPVDGREVLARVRELPIATWNYKAQDADVRHMGPMAQDFHTVFRLGEGDRRIATIDPDGVALAAIQGLSEELEARLDERDAEIAALRAQLEAMEARLVDLEAPLRGGR